MTKSCNKTTSKKVASTSSRVLRDNRYSDAAKSAAASALSQRATSCRGKKSK